MRLLPIPCVDNITVYKKTAIRKRIVCSTKDNCKDYQSDSSKCLTEKCCKCKQSPRNIMVNYEKSVLQQYDEYTKVAPNFERLSTAVLFGKEIKQELLASYKHSSEFDLVKDEIKNSFKKNYTGRCPFCKLSEPETLDHYLSKSKYPQFTLFAPNLVPCCYLCNTLKDTFLTTDDNLRSFFHYYYDDIPELPILECRISINNNVPDYSFYTNVETECKNADIFRRQFIELELGDRYREACNEILSQLHKELEGLYSSFGIDDCEKILKIRLNAAVESRGVNHYETAMLRGYLDNLEHLLCNKLVKTDC